MEYLQELRLHVDDLINNRYRGEDWSKIFPKPKGFLPFKHVISLPMVRDPRLKELAHNYILTLYKDPKTYGYLYFLASQKLMTRLNLQWSGEWAIDDSQYSLIRKEIEDMARGFTPQDCITYEVTCIELLYFYAMLLNPHLTWVAVDYLLRGNKSHDYLILQKVREVKNMQHISNGVGFGKE